MIAEECLPSEEGTRDAPSQTCFDKLRESLVDVFANVLQDFRERDRERECLLAQGMGIP